MTIRPSPLMALGAILACASLPAGPASATSPAQVARTLDLARTPESTVEVLPATPEEAPSIVGPLHAGDRDVQIQLEGADPGPRNPALLDVPFDVSLQ